MAEAGERAGSLRLGVVGRAKIILIPTLLPEGEGLFFPLPRGEGSRVRVILQSISDLIDYYYLGNTLIIFNIYPN